MRSRGQQGWLSHSPPHRPVGRRSNPGRRSGRAPARSGKESRRAAPAARPPISASPGRSGGCSGTAEPQAAGQRARQEMSLQPRTTAPWHACHCDRAVLTIMNRSHGSAAAGESHLARRRLLVLRPFQRETLQCSCALSTVRSRPYGKGYPAPAPPYMQTVRRHGWGRG